MANILDKSVVVRVIDNASSDSSVSLVRSQLPQADVITSTKNLGFSGGHNLGFKYCETDLVMVINPDFIINWPGVKKLIEAFADLKLGAAQGKIIRGLNKVETIIDSAGIVLSLTLNGIDRGAGHRDVGQYESEQNVSAVTAAAAIYRLEALKGVAYAGGEVYDNDFFAYKEDVDLGWRLNKAGWHVRYIPIDVGLHTRARASQGRFGWSLHPVLFKQRLSDERTRYSFRNWLWMLAKNATIWQLATRIVFIGLRLITFIFITLLYPPFIGTWLDTLRGLPRMLAKRKSLN